LRKGGKKGFSLYPSRGFISANEFASAIETKILFPVACSIREKIVVKKRARTPGKK
jgi:hypothetical protein